jgi:threonine dehydrogenase-like Zn-dependent dehydrogenase
MPNVALAPSFIGDGRIDWKQREYRDPGPTELLIRVRANAICGSDRGQYFGGSEPIAGHEAAGEVVAAGDLTNTAEGTRGVVYLKDFCGECRNCRAHATNQCLAKRADMGFTHDGGYGPFEVIHETNFFPVGDEVSFAEATMLLDAMGTTGHALSRAELIRRDMQSIYIAGAGPIGLGLLVMAKVRYGTSVPVYISDISPWRLNLAQELGGLPVDARDPRGLAEMGKVDVAFDASGKQAARQAALAAVESRGVFVCVGGGEGLVVTDVGKEMLLSERAIVGSEYFNYDEFPNNLQVLLGNRQLIGKLITDTFPVSSLGEAFEKFLAGETGKVVVTQDD